MFLVTLDDSMVILQKKYKLDSISKMLLLALNRRTKENLHDIVIEYERKARKSSVAKVSTQVDDTDSRKFPLWSGYPVSRSHWMVGCPLILYSASLKVAILLCQYEFVCQFVHRLVVHQ